MLLPFNTVPSEEPGDIKAHPSGQSKQPLSITSTNTSESKSDAFAPWKTQYKLRHPLGARTYDAAECPSTLNTAISPPRTDLRQPDQEPQPRYSLSSKTLKTRIRHPIPVHGHRCQSVTEEARQISRGGHSFVQLLSGGFD